MPIADFLNSKVGVLDAAEKLLRIQHFAFRSSLPVMALPQFRNRIFEIRNNIIFAHTKK